MGGAASCKRCVVFPTKLTSQLFCRFFLPFSLKQDACTSLPLQRGFLNSMLVHFLMHIIALGIEAHH